MLIIKITFFWLICLGKAHVTDGSLSILITRKHKGDIFTIQGEKHHKDLCVGISGGTAELNDENGSECKCEQRHPVYRDDLNVCVNDMQECALVPFVSGTIKKKIPYVFLPLKGQIVFPSAEIVISENGSPVCVVSGGQFLGRNGWLNLRNSSETEPPFRLFRDKGRTYLQWFGETSMRLAMEGRIILVHLMCKDATLAEEPKVFTPCIAFRVAGNPSVREVIFATDVQLAEGQNVSLNLREYIAIGLCSLFLAIVYVASIFFYLHWRKQKKKQSQKKKGESSQLTLGEEGIIKNNPLLQANRHFGICGEDNAGYATDSNSYSSDPDRISDLLCLDEEDSTVHQNMQTSAIVHPCDTGYGETTLIQDPNSIERLPEENVSIIETLEVKEIHPETIKAISSANGRRKLYFNPSYFEPELLKVPPPAALEFLIKIREVITIAKLKMSSKKFSPSLLGIPEEDGSYKTETNVGSDEITSKLLKVSNPPIFSEGEENFKAPVNNDKASNEFFYASDSKQKIIQKWLENVPLGISKSIQCEKSNHFHQGKSADAYRESESTDLRQTNEFNNKLISTRQINKEEPAIVLKKQEKKRLPTKTKPFSSSLQNMSKLNVEKCKEININGEDEKINPKKAKKENTKIDISDDQMISDRSNKICFDKNACSSTPTSSYQTLTNKRENSNYLKETNIQNLSFTKNLMDTVIQELTSLRKTEKSECLYGVEKMGRKQDRCDENLNNGSDNQNEINKSDKNKLSNSKNNILIASTIEDEERNICKNNKENILFENFNIKNEKNLNKNRTQDEHEYEIILLNEKVQQLDKSKSKTLNNVYEETGTFSKYEKSEGYSLVSEVYVNDENSLIGKSKNDLNNSFNGAMTSKKISCEVTNEKTSRLTIHVKDSPKQNKEIDDESENFEPDTLERKQSKSKACENIETATKCNEQNTNGKYSNQKFHDLDYCNKKDDLETNENFTDSLERPTILLKTTGSFKQNSLEKNVNELFRNLNWTRMENFGSLREIYEAKNRNHRKRTETTSLIDSIKSDNDCGSTHSWGEERRNKLLHRGIVLHIGNDKSHQIKNKHCSSKSSLKKKEKTSFEAQKSETELHVSKSPLGLSANEISILFSSKTNSSPPLPFPRSVSSSPCKLYQCQPRSSTPSPLNFIENFKNGSNVFPFSPIDEKNSSDLIVKVGAKIQPDVQCQSVGSFLKLPANPPRPPKDTTFSSPPLPPRKTKPPLPPKNLKITVPKSHSTAFATRPLPPLPFSSPNKNSRSALAFVKNIETMSNLSGASMDSLNSLEYESFYTIPYEEKEEKFYQKSISKKVDQNLNHSNHSENLSVNAIKINKELLNGQRNSISCKEKSQKINDTDKKILKKRVKSAKHKVEDSGYLSTDSSESYCPQILLPSQIGRIPEGIEFSNAQNSETEESICDGASESGAESTATDSFFYGNFNKTETTGTTRSKSLNPKIYRYSLRLSDVEVNSDTERHSVPIMVRP